MDSFMLDVRHASFVKVARRTTGGCEREQKCQTFPRGVFLNFATSAEDNKSSRVGPSEDTHQVRSEGKHQAQVRGSRRALIAGYF